MPKSSEVGVKIIDGEIDLDVVKSLGVPLGIENDLFYFRNDQDRTVYGVSVKHLDADTLAWALNEAAWARLTDPNEPKSLNGIEVRHPADVSRLRNYLLDMWNKRDLYDRTDAALTQLAETPMYFGRTNPAHVTASHALKTATLWWVGAEMVDLLMATAPTVPSDLRTFELPRPSECGLVVFEKPWIGQDAIQPDNDHGIQVDAIGWGEAIMNPCHSRPRSTPAICLYSYTKLELTNHNDFSLALAHGLIQEGRISAAHVASKQVLGNMTGQVWGYLGRSDWPHDDELIQAPFAELSPESAESWVEDRRVLAAFWNLIAQERIAERTTTYSPRPVQREATRRGIAKEINHTTVIDIRKRAPQSETEIVNEGSTDSRYSHRWWVDPFPRWQRVGKGRSERRLTMVRGHVKGPDNKPLVIKDKVRAWR